MTEIKCRKCQKVLTEDELQLINTVYGCDTGCPYVMLEIECECGDEFTAGTFGEAEDDQDRQEYIEELMAGYHSQPQAKTKWS